MTGFQTSSGDSVSCFNKTVCSHDIVTYTQVCTIEYTGRGRPVRFKKSGGGGGAVAQKGRYHALDEGRLTHLLIIKG